jgi:hypothetical protein
MKNPRRKISQKRKVFFFNSENYDKEFEESLEMDEEIEQEDVKRRPNKQDYEDDMPKRRRKDIDSAKVHSDVFIFLYRLLNLWQL